MTDPGRAPTLVLVTVSWPFGASFAVPTLECEGHRSQHRSHRLLLVSPPRAQTPLPSPPRGTRCAFNIHVNRQSLSVKSPQKKWARLSLLKWLHYSKPFFLLFFIFSFFKNFYFHFFICSFFKFFIFFIFFLLLFLFFHLLSFSFIFFHVLSFCWGLKI